MRTVKLINVATVKGFQLPGPEGLLMEVLWSACAIEALSSNRYAHFKKFSHFIGRNRYLVLLIHHQVAAIAFYVVGNMVGVNYI
jgi:hypothetical protein